MEPRENADGQAVLKPADMARFIQEHGIAAELIVPAIETPTVTAAALALGVAAEQIVKTVVFLVHGEPVLVIASGTHLIDRRALADRFGVGKKQIKLADAATVLSVTGYPVGGVPPFGHVTRARTLLDRAISRWGVVYGGGGDERALMRITPQELARVVEGEWITLDSQTDGRTDGVDL